AGGVGRASVVECRAVTGPRISAGGPLKDAFEVGTDHAVFGRSAGVDVQVRTRAARVDVAETIVGAPDAVGRVLKHGVGREGGFGTQIAAKLDASVGAGNVEEACTI